MTENERKKEIRKLSRQTRRMVEGLKRGREKLDRGEEQYCSFCGKGENEVQALLVGADAYICDECIALATEVLKDDLS